MNNTPQTFPVVLAAGETQRVPVPGNWMQVMSCTVATFEFAFDNDPLTTGEPFVSYPAKNGFAGIRFRDSLGAGCTIVVQVADTLPQDNRGNRDQLSAIGVSLAAIDIDTDDLASILAELQGSLTVVGWGRYATVAAATQVMAQRAARTMCQFQADPENADFVYIGFDNTVSAANWALKLAPGQGDTLEVGRDAIWAFSPTINQYLGWMDF